MIILSVFEGEHLIGSPDYCCASSYRVRVSLADSRKLSQGSGAGTPVACGTLEHMEKITLTRTVTMFGVETATFSVDLPEGFTSWESWEQSDWLFDNAAPGTYDFEAKSVDDAEEWTLTAVEPTEPVSIPQRIKELGVEGLSEEEAVVVIHTLLNNGVYRLDDNFRLVRTDGGE